MKRKRNWLIILIALLASAFLTCQLPWHVNRNTHNVLPTGKLTLVAANTYQDEQQLIWELQPQQLNIFHQPEHPIEHLKNAYPNLNQKPVLDLHNPNLKLLSKTGNGASYEAILQPNGSYLTTGPTQGTYNYGHPAGFIGITKHTLLDVIPHFINAHYQLPEPK